MIRKVALQMQWRSRPARRWRSLSRSGSKAHAAQVLAKGYHIDVKLDVEKESHILPCMERDSRCMMDEF